MNDTVAGFGLFLAALFVGWVTWGLATHTERLRRVRGDLRANRAGRRTLWEMWRRQLVALAGVCVIAVIGAALAVAVYVGSR